MFTSRHCVFFLLLLFIPFAFNDSALGQILLNEIAIDTSNPNFEVCEYVEVRGTPGAVIAANTTFLSIDGESGSFGQINYVAEIGGRTIGSNGTLAIISSTAGTCPNRTYPSGTTVVTTFSSSLGFGSETYLLVRTNSPGVFLKGDDVDTNDDGQIDANLGATPIDGFGFAQNPSFSRIYGGAPTIYDAISGANGLDLPDAATRFPNNTTPFAASAFYFGELAAPEEGTAYQAPFSPNFPNGGALTPGGPNVPAALPPRSAVDFDGDGKTDISIFRPNGGSGSEWWYLKSSNGGNYATQFGSPTDKLVAADYTGDGKADIAFFRPSTGQWFILRSEDNSFYAFPFGASGDVPAPADFDGDGKADAAVFRPSNSTWFIQNSGGGTTIQAFGTAGDVPVAADYDGDNKADLAVFRPNGATGSEWWVQRSTAGLIATQFGTPTDKTVVGDYTGDGKADIAFWRPSTGQWYILRSEDFSFYAFPFGASTDIPAPGDYDGDGKTDAAVFRPSNSTWFAQGSTSGTIIQQFGTTGDVPVPNEFVR